MIEQNGAYEHTWSPFDPVWYKDAFDKFTSTADQLFAKESIIAQGFHLPDADGSKSSVFRKDAVLNNSFNESLLRETLKDIYLNTTHKLIASNHDNVHFYQWHGNMQDMSIIANTGLCQFVIPTYTFISQKDRDRFKRSQYYRKWISIQDILNNWDVFKFAYLLFIDQKIYSEYEIRMDDQETTIRFQYFDQWMRNNLPVYIYKFDTNASCRVKISRELVDNQWNWKMPVEYITDQRVLNSTHVMATFNMIADTNIRTDGKLNVSSIGDNIEFLEIKDGYIDLQQISEFNQIMIESERKEWIWMSIIVPKFFHEYPILLPTDTVYRPYEADFQPVSTYVQNMIQDAKTKDLSQSEKQVYVDMRGKLQEYNDGWRKMIRPIVLSDAYEESSMGEVLYDSIADALDQLKKHTIAGADLIENFRLDVPHLTNGKLMDHLDAVEAKIHEINDAYHTLLNILKVEDYETFDEVYQNFITEWAQLRVDGLDSKWFIEDQFKTTDLWQFISPLIYIPRELVDQYDIALAMRAMKNHGVLWIDPMTLVGKIRFQRPIEIQDFWTFEYDTDRHVWRPCPLQLEYRFPNVYLPKLPDGATGNHIYKAFFFYSDTMNVRETTTDISRPTPDWSENVRDYTEKEAIYRDLFIEKFYWMGIRKIYDGLVITKCRWEILEYVIDNDSYERFNQLFLKTMDPYFKMGLATFLKGSNNEFPFDEAVSKMNEAINLDWNGYQKISNFERYLDKTWIPSYFDTIEKIMDDYAYEERLLKRPRSTFDTLRLLPVMKDIQKDISVAIASVYNTLVWLIEQLNQETYGLNVQSVVDLKDIADMLKQNMESIIQYTNDLDLEIFSNDDINHLIECFNKHNELVKMAQDKFTEAYDDVLAHTVYAQKMEVLVSIREMNDETPGKVSDITKLTSIFDIDEFMRVTNDLRGYLNFDKYNPDDNSLLGKINQFDDPWSEAVKEARNKLFSSTAVLYGSFDPSKSYTPEEVETFTSLVNQVYQDIDNLEREIRNFCNIKSLEVDEEVIDKLAGVRSYLDRLNLGMNEYMEYSGDLIDHFTGIHSKLEVMVTFNIGDTEGTIANGIIQQMNEVIEQLSYIVGQQDKAGAIEAYKKIESLTSDWAIFVAHEQEVFEKLTELVKPPIPFFEYLNQHSAFMNAMVEYMDTVNIPFTPDTEWPSYSSVYETKEIEIVSGGFNHKVGEIVYIPKMGAYQITEVSDDVCKALMLEDCGYRNTNFRNPNVQSNPFDGITNGAGLGISVKPTKVDEVPIIDDSATDDTMMRIQNAVYMVGKYIYDPNSYNNKAFQYSISDILDIQNRWNKIVSIYQGHISPSVCAFVTECVNKIVSIVDPCESYIDLRSKIDLPTIFSMLNTIRKNANENWADRLNQCYFDLYDFYGNGSIWEDETQLKLLLDNIKQISIAYVHTTENLPADIIDIQANMVSEINVARTTLDSLPTARLEVVHTIESLNVTLQHFPDDKRKDVWYRIKNVNVAVEGSGYKAGDILEIVPELPKDQYGEYIHDQEELIMNDVILLKVKTVINGVVTEIEPLMDYAIPYKIWGIREVRNRVGTGTGLTVDVYSYELMLKDSVLFNSIDVDVSETPRFDENDMFMFKMQNIHDLDVSYEIFLGGKQITNFVQRHKGTDDVLNPQEIDIVYLNANDVMELRNSSVYIPEEHYFVYRIEDLQIVNPGKGYTKGQTIYVDLDNMLLKLQVDEVANNPYGEIDRLIVDNENAIEGTSNPSKEEAKVVSDTLNNIDDEFTNSYYDQITEDGVEKAISNSFGIDEYSFIAKRFDEIENADRNKVFMYPDVLPLNGSPAGDPDEGWYLGTRIDNEQLGIQSAKYNGILSVIPFLDPKYKDSDRTPPNQDVKGEFQLVDRLRIHRHPLNGEDPTNPDDPGDNPDNPGDPDTPTEGCNCCCKPISEEYIMGAIKAAFLGGELRTEIDNWDCNGCSPITKETIIDSVRKYLVESQKVTETFYGWSKCCCEAITDKEIVAAVNKFASNPSEYCNYCSPIEEEYILNVIDLAFSGTDLDREIEDWSSCNCGPISKERIIESVRKYLVNRETPDGTTTGWICCNCESISDDAIIDATSKYFNITHDTPTEPEDPTPEDPTTPEEPEIKVHVHTEVCLTVETYKDLPKHYDDYPDAEIGCHIKVLHDETYGGHTMIYTIRTQVAAGFFVYDTPVYADDEWVCFDINWMNCDYYPDYPSLKTQYPDAPWDIARTYQYIDREISSKKYTNHYAPTAMKHTTYIHDLTVDDLSVWNDTLRKWEDLHDTSRWSLEVHQDEESGYGFKLTFLKDGFFDYDMQLYLNKTPNTQMKNASLKEDAVFDIKAVIDREVYSEKVNLKVNTGRHLRIRKILPFEQKETFELENGQFEMDFKVANYKHFKNEIHLEDIKIFNYGTGRYENILDPNLFEVRFKDPKAVERGYETQTNIVQTYIGKSGNGYNNGPVWGYNREYGVHIFGTVTCEYQGDGHIFTFTPIHCPNPPEEDLSLEFELYQRNIYNSKQAAKVVIEFQTEKVPVFGDGYIHNVVNPMAPVPEEFKVIVQYDLAQKTKYEVMISKKRKQWTFVEPKWVVSPTFHLDYPTQQDRVYIITDKGRFPLTNTSTGKQSIHVNATDDGTDVTFLNLYRRYEHLEVVSAPYPMRSVYVQRRIPQSGFIDLEGKLNKPLNKKYFEFWVNGKLMHDEVTIITPTKLFMHGLKSLKNFEIIEINRDPNEYFSDNFLQVNTDSEKRPYQEWNYRTYLDNALEGNLEGDNYTTDEQEYLLTPVWKQVMKDHPEYKNYPQNVDIEDDVLSRVNEDDYPIDDGLDTPQYQFLVVDTPTIEGQQLVDRNITFERLGLTPLTDDDLIDMMNEEWKDEIGTETNFPVHTIQSDSEWYGLATRLYDEYGILVHTLNEAAYKVTDSNMLRINTDTKIGRIVRRGITFDLT